MIQDFKKYGEPQYPRGLHPSMIGLDDFGYFNKITGCQSKTEELLVGFDSSVNLASKVTGVDLGYDLKEEDKQSKVGIMIGLDAARSISKSYLDNAKNKLKKMRSDVVNTTETIGAIHTIKAKVELARVNVDKILVPKLKPNVRDDIRKQFAIHTRWLRQDSKVELYLEDMKFKSLEEDLICNYISTVDALSDFKTKASTLSVESKNNIAKLKRIEMLNISNKKLKTFLSNYREGDIVLIHMGLTKTLYVRHMFISFNDVQDKVIKIPLDCGYKTVTLELTSNVNRVLAKALSVVDDAAESLKGLSELLDTIDTTLKMLDQDIDLSKQSTINHALTNLNIKLLSYNDTLANVKIAYKMILKLI